MRTMIKTTLTAAALALSAPALAQQSPAVISVPAQVQAVQSNVEQVVSPAPVAPGAPTPGAPTTTSERDLYEKALALQVKDMGPFAIIDGKRCTALSLRQIGEASGYVCEGDKAWAAEINLPKYIALAREQIANKGTR